MADPSAASSFFAAPSSPSRTTSPTIGGNAGGNFFASNFFASSAAGDFLNSLGVNSASSPFFPHSHSAAASNSQAGTSSQMLARNSTKTLKCPKCNWHYKYQETLEIHMKEKHADQEVVCMFCVENQAHPKLARGETYSCGYKPYRCELCKYSTTTKGNLSIHMQSDKHLHALQEIPQSLAAAAAGHSQILLGQFGAQTSPNPFVDPTSAGLPAQFNSNGGCSLQCLICLSFSTDRLDEMLAHLDRDRGQPQEGDIAALHGYFQCLLCPYSTNLKANFQLHTRTDKHLQRVQLINHLREASALLSPAEQFARLGSLKSAIQVRCQPCQEIFSCAPSLGDHCHSAPHLQKMTIGGSGGASSDAATFFFAPSMLNKTTTMPSDSDENAAAALLLEHFLRNAHFCCGKCQQQWSMPASLIDVAIEHSTNGVHNNGGDGGNGKGGGEGGCGGEEEAAGKAEGNENSSSKEAAERAIGWQEMEEFLIGAGQAQKMMETPLLMRGAKGQKCKEEKEGKKAASSSKNADDQAQNTAKAKCCPLCSTNEPQPDLPRHIAEQHNIPQEIAQRLAQQTEPTATLSAPSFACIKSEPSSDSSPMAAEPSVSSLSVAELLATTRRPSPSHSAPSPQSPPPSSSAEDANANNPIFAHRCPECPLAFRTARQLKAHSLSHSGAQFRLVHRCADEESQCAEEFATRAELDLHVAEKHAADGNLSASEPGGHFCDICQDGQKFDSDQALLAHFNSEAHLRRAGRAQQQQQQSLMTAASTSSANPSPSSSNSKVPGASNRRSNSANPTKSLPYICNVCSQAFGQPGTLDTHLRSMAHTQRMAKLMELIQSGDVDPAKPVFEEPEQYPPQRSIAEAAKERKTQMGKLSMATVPQTQQQQQQAQPMQQQSSAASNSNALLDNMFKPDQQQQQMMLQMMAQMFGGTMAQQQQQEEMMANQQQQAFQMAQMAQMMLTAQMAAAQMAAAAAAAQANNNNNNNNATNANNGFGGLLEMFTKQQNGHHQQQQAEEMNNNNGAEIGEPPKAKRPRPNVTPPITQQQQMLNQWANSNGEGSERASREGSTAPSNHPAAGLDLASVLQALASGTMPQMPPSSSSSSSMPFPFGGSTPPSAAVPDPSNLLMAMAAAQQQQQQFLPSTASTSANSSASLAPTGPQQPAPPASHSNAPSPSPQKRARTRIGDDHIKILRQYFDINNSPSEEQIKEMAQRTNLAEKVIKHWFRNTLFKERQRDKDSPYNFSIPPQMGIDLATYHRTGEARIVPLVKQENKEEDTDRKEEYEEKKGEGIKNEGNENDGTEMPEGMGKGKRRDSDENDGHSNGQMEEEEGKNENEIIQRQESVENENEEKKPESNEGVEREEEEEEEEELGEEELLEEGDDAEAAERSRSNAENMAAVAADLLATIGRQHQQSQSSAMASGLPFGNVAGAGGFNPAEQFAQMFSSAAALSSTFPSNPFGAAAFNPFNAIGAACGAPALPFNPFGPVPVSLPSGQSASSATLPSAAHSAPQHCLQSNSVPTTSSSNNVGQNQIQQANANGNSQSNAGGTMGSGRRANRTRFTDFQLRTLQDFFDKQAYPKDDDLEMLSKKMGLSPRVIVVWFQNARQKARKVFEQQPHLMAQHHSMAAAVTAAAASAEHQQMDPRFARTPSSNFQCRVCGQVFQRYLELIQHQQRVCLAGLEQHQEPEKQQQQQSAETLISGFLNGKLAEENGGGMDGEEGEGENGKQQQTPSSFESAQEMLFRQLMAPLQQQQEQMMKTERPNSTEENPAPAKNNVAAFHKRCPFCGLLFHSRNKMTQHFAQRHPEQQQQLDADSLPQADEEQIVPATIGMDLLLQSMMGAAAAGASAETTMGAAGPLDLSLNAGGGRQNGNGTPFEPKEECGGFRSNEASLSPAAFSSAGENDFANESQACSPLAALLPALFQPLSSTQRPPNMGSPLNGASGGSNSSKRFRTHLTPMQVFIMKSLFHDYKTPSMQECDALGQKIGLHKRVVQVWFQNARAKERKTNSGSGSAEPEEAVPNCGSSQHCQLCDVPLPNGQSIQEHVFSLEHIEQIKERGALLRGINGEGGDELLRKEGGGGGEGGSTTPGGTNPSNGGDATAAALSQQFGPLAQLPYFALAAAGLGQSAAANGGGIPPLLYDPALFGTPVPALKIPETVAQQILIDMTQRKECSNFTQDGLELADLEMKLAAEDFQQAGTVDLEVGWGCIQCGNVFQQAELLQNHQKLICLGAADSSISGGTFRLVQTHYQCQCCPQQQKFGTQDDFCAHCHSEEHKSARRATIR